MANTRMIESCCGAYLLYHVNKEYIGKNYEFPDYTKYDKNKGLMLAILNEDQIRLGSEEALLKAGYKILIDGWYNINMANPPYNTPTWCTLYAKIEAPEKMRSRFDEDAPKWKKALTKTREFFFRHTIPKS